MTVVLVPADRVERWVDNFSQRHGAASLSVVDGLLRGEAQDGSRFLARLPFADEYDGQPAAAAFTEAMTAPDTWGLLLVRKGGFAVARMDNLLIVESKVGQRHVQGRTKAGGQSQQRFARRRDNQARQAYEAAAGHAARILGAVEGVTRRMPIVAGGDRAAVEEVLTDPRLSGLRVCEPFLTVPDPRRAILERAAQDAASARFEVINA